MHRDLTETALFLSMLTSPPSTTRDRFVREDLTETAMFLSMLSLESGATDLRAILREVGMSLGHRERLLLALTTRR